MNKHFSRVLMSSVLTAAMLTAAMPAKAQLVRIDDIAGSSSIFVFPGEKAGPKRFVPKTKSRRTKANRVASATKINRQYVTLAKVKPRRQRTEAVDPENLPAAIRIRTMPREDAARLFAGVGEYYMDREDTDNAIKFFRESNSLDPKYTIAQTGLSEALALKGNEVLVQANAELAKTFFDEALQFNPRNAVAYYGLAEVFADSDKDADSMSNYEKALALDGDLTEIYVPLGILYYQGGQVAKADDLLTKALITSKESAELEYFIGLIRYSQNKTDDALRAFQRATTLDPNYAEAHYYTGEALVRLGRIQESLPKYQEAIRLKSNYYEAYSRMGSAYYELKNYPEAIKAYRQAVRLKNDEIEAHINHGDANRLAGNYNDAEASYNLASTFISRDPSFPPSEAAEVYNKAGFAIAKQCEINMKRALPCRWDVAVKYLEKAVEISNSPVDRANLGWAYYNAARNDMYDKRETVAREKLVKARTHLQAAVDSNSEYMEGPLLNLGMTYSDLGDHQGAIDTLSKVVEREPKWVFALNELGIAYRRANNFKAAASQFRKAVDRDKNFAEAYYNLGEAEFRNGNLGEAKKAHDALAKLGRKDLAARLQLVSGGQIR